MPTGIICNDRDLATRAIGFLADHNVPAMLLDSSDQPGSAQLPPWRLPQSPSELVICADEERGGILLIFLDRRGAHEPTTIRSGSVEDALSSYVMANHRSNLALASSRHDRGILTSYHDQYRFGRIANPIPWIVSNPFVMLLKERKYANLFAYVTNERGLFFKLPTLAVQRNYWNSSLNGGLPLTKKRDPIHEGTYLLHDIFHFSFPDPLYDGGTTKAHRGAYIVHRMASEAATMVLADMLAMDEARVHLVGYDPSPRRIFPLYKSLALPPKILDKFELLLQATLRYAICGDDSFFVKSGADRRNLAEFKGKYENFFAVDMIWNASNFDFMLSECRRNALVGDYYRSLGVHAAGATLSAFAESVVCKGMVSIDAVVSHFLSAAARAFLYPERFDEFRYKRRAATNFYAGQMLIFYRFHKQLDDRREREQAERLAAKISRVKTLNALERTCIKLDKIVENAVLCLAQRGHLLPHEVPLYLMHAPHFPAAYYSYERSLGDGASIRTISDQVLKGLVS